MRWGHSGLGTAMLVAALLLHGSHAASHPSLFFSASDEPELRQALQVGVRAAAYDGMSTYCGWLNGSDWWWSDPCLEEHAFRYRMDGETLYLNAAKNSLQQAIANEASVLFDPSNLDWSGAYPVPIAVAFDLIFDQLSPAERLAVVSWLEQYGALLYESVDDGETVALTSNTISAYGGLGLVALAILHDSSHPDLAAWLDASAHQLGTVAFADAWNPGGSYDEGYARSLYGTPLALRFAEAYRRETGVDLLDSANIEEAPDWFVYGWLPHGAYPRFGNDAGLLRAAFGGELLLLVDRAQSELGKWGWHQLHGPTGVDELYRGLPISDRLAIALWYPDEVSDVPSPAAVGAELDRWFGDTHNPQSGHVGSEPGRGGVGIFRTGWDADAVVMAFKVSDEWHPYSHNDSSSFVLSAFGASVAMDPGSSTASAQRNDHNVVTVASYDDGAERRTSYRGELLDRFSCQLGAYVRADARYPTGDHEPGDPDDPADDTWTPVEQAERSLAFVRGPRPYVLAVDDLSVDGATAHSYTWRLQLTNQWMALGGTGPPWDPIRFENNAGGQQLTVSFLEPDSSYFATVEAHPDTWNHYQLSAQTEPTVDARFMALVQPLRSGVDEMPVVTRLAAAGGVGAHLAWSDGVDLWLARFGSSGVVYGGSSSDAELLLVRNDPAGAPMAWMVAEGSDVVAEGLGLLDSGGLPISASYYAGELEVQTPEPPSLRQIVAYAPGALNATLNGEPVPFARAGNYVALPVECATEERCNGIDDDCDLLVDEADAVDATTWYPDADGDGHGVPQQELAACHQPAGYAPDADDCDDTDDESYPGAPEQCEDGHDNDCDGATDLDDLECSSDAMVMGTTGGCSCRLQPSKTHYAHLVGLSGLLGLIGSRRRRRNRR